MFAGLKHENRSSFIKGGDVFGSWRFTNGAGAFVASSGSDSLEGGLPSLVRDSAGVYTLSVPRCRRMVVLSAYVVTDSAVEAERRKVSVLTETPATGQIELSTGLASDDTEADPTSGTVLKVVVRLEGEY